MKGKRQEKILELIREYDIETQDDLTKRLQKAGFSTTQGTISRDIRDLKLTKVMGENGKQKYTSIQNDNLHVSSKYKRVLSEGIVHMESAENILVVRTVPGMAMACAAAIDSIRIQGIVGCIAGDDTIMCVIKTTQQIPAVMEKMYSLLRESR